ncbi:LysM peptidoglycan-binding domain-containing protein [Heliobacterium gestii]|uniref:LysM peptidoglycan-binding domain-containing protein n=1 Tax=Heliomicrobium gestii TaxID=2699 RepID=A0A845LBD0_HELGE|nr:peptidoglycan-binding protein [Heliomicrobium gestii]MBM7866801.1 peptidoglycan hydrolase-like protein with peptidoglycan-binding domain [Heliomicrobium gestii]MZP42230.1 LysM peptidoglycan-binding domain-containing protein [Heliomicrobium gestii]
MIVYYVRPGDTLTAIAQRYGVTLEQLLAANRLPNPDVLQVGQAITIPTPALPGGLCPTLSLGARGAQVRRLQQLLARSGFNPGPIDGIFGTATRNAVIALQRRQNREPSGVVERAEWQALGVNCARPPIPPFPRQPAQRPPASPQPPRRPAPAPPRPTPPRPAPPEPAPPPTPAPPAGPTCPDLARGNTGEAVRRLQRLLDAAEYPVTVTGVFDQATENAVRTFQSEVGINPTGRADLETWLSLGESCGDLPRPPRHRITRVINNIRYTLYTNKAVYRRGEPILITFIKTNVGAQPITLNYPSSQRYDLNVELGLSGIEVWRWSRGRSFNPVAETIVLRPTEYQAFQETWNQSSNTGQEIRYPGRYILTATNLGTRQGVSVEFELQPAVSASESENRMD